MALPKLLETLRGVAKRWAEPYLVLAIVLPFSPPRAPLLIAPTLIPKTGDARQGLATVCSPVPPPFFFLMVPMLFYPMSGRGKNAVSSERGPRVTGGGNPHSMAPGVKDPPQSPPPLPTPLPPPLPTGPNPLQPPQDCS